MALCPDGHQSGATDYCDVCGLAIGAVSAAPTVAVSTASAKASGEPCPNCLLPRTDDPFCEGCGYDFAKAAPIASPVVATPANPSLAATLEATALDLDAELEKAIAEANAPTPPTTPAPASVSVPVSVTEKWTAVAVADRAYYDAVVAEGEIDPNAYPFPPYCPERRFTVSGDTVRIGRSSTTRGTVVEIDLTGPPTDPGVSHLHAVLQARPDGGWAVLDPGSTNGTVLNDDTAPIPENTPVPVEDGFRIHVGVWTTLTLVKEP